MIRIMYDTLYSFCINFDTTQLCDVTFLLRNIIVTLKVRQKNHLGIISEVVSILNSIKLLVFWLLFCFQIS